MPDAAATPVTFACRTKDYESSVVVDSADPERAGALVAEWLEMQLWYLAALRPGETVSVTGATS